MVADEPEENPDNGTAGAVPRQVWTVYECTGEEVVLAVPMLLAPDDDAAEKGQETDAGDVDGRASSSDAARFGEPGSFEHSREIWAASSSGACGTRKCFALTKTFWACVVAGLLLVVGVANLGMEAAVGVSGGKDSLNLTAARADELLETEGQQLGILLQNAEKLRTNLKEVQKFFRNLKVPKQSVIGPRAATNAKEGDN
jgi:hypothetical protein